MEGYRPWRMFPRPSIPSTLSVLNTMSTAVTTRVARIQASFEELAARRTEPLLHRVTGTWEFDVEGAGRWWVTVTRGSITVSVEPRQADCVATCDEETFTRIIDGKQNLVAAALRGAVKVTGDIALGVSFQRLLR
jgi:predicted lipid carrier protein YhbT